MPTVRRNPVNIGGAGVDELLVAGVRTLHRIVLRRTDGAPDELVGQHEDLDVAGAEVERLDRELRALHIEGAHVIETDDQIIATDDPDDSLPNLEGPIVSSETVTTRNLKRGERPDNVAMIPGDQPGRGRLILP